MATTGTTKICPQCQAHVRTATKTCRHCRHEFEASRYHDLGPIIGWVAAGALGLGYVWQATH